MPDLDPLISISQAATEIGVNKSTLSRQVKAGAVRSHNGKVRLSEVLADRASNIDLGRSQRGAGKLDRPGAKSRPAPHPVTDENEVQEVEPDTVVMVDGVAMSYADARAMKEGYLARLKKLEYETKRGDLAPVGEMVAFVERMLSTVRDRLLTIPGKLGDVLNRDQVERLRSELYEAMEELSDPRSVLDEAAALPRPAGDGDEGDEAAAPPEPRGVGRTVSPRRAKDERRTW